MTTMRIAIVNPNTTASMTQAIAAQARAVVRPSTEIIPITSPTGPVSIEGYFDEALSVPGMLTAIMAADTQGVDGHVIACFDDTGLDAARQCARAPVVGIGEAAYHVATLISQRFAVVTTTKRSVPALRANVLRYGFERHCSSVRASEIPVLDLEKDVDAALARLEREARVAIEEEGAEAIVLGCAGMANLQPRLEASLGCPVVDGVSASVGLLETLIAMKLKTSRSGGYATSPAKELLGPLAPLMTQ